MPKLLLLAPCYRVAYDSKDQRATLIELFQGFEVSVGPISEIGPDSQVSEFYPIGTSNTVPTAIPMRWVIFTLWRREPGEENETFVQTCQLKYPNGEVGFTGDVEFTLTKGHHRSTVNVLNFPVHQSGDYIIEVLVRKKDGSLSVFAGSFPILVKHIAEATGKI